MEAEKNKPGQVAILIFVLWSYGVLALVASALFLISFVYPFTPDLNAWYAPGAEIALLFTVGVAIFGFYTCLGGRPFFSFSGSDAAKA